MTSTKTPANSNVKSQTELHRGNGRESDNKRSAGRNSVSASRSTSAMSPDANNASDIGPAAAGRASSVRQLRNSRRAPASLGRSPLAVVPMDRYNDWCEQRSASDCVVWTSFSSSATVPLSCDRTLRERHSNNLSFFAQFRSRHSSLFRLLLLKANMKSIDKCKHNLFNL